VRGDHIISVSCRHLLALLVAAIALSACSATGPLFIRHTDPSPEEALIYLYRPSRNAARTGAPEMFVNGQKSIKRINGGYSVAYVKPGQVAVLAKKGGLWGFRDMTILLNVNPGKTYYVRLLPSLFPVVPLVVTEIRVSLALVEEDTAFDEITNCRYIVPERLRFEPN